MREKKFRVLTQTTCKILGYVDIYDLLRSGPDVLPDLEEAVLEGVKFEQYTGLKDKNGKEIYEGDIVKEYDEGLSNVGKVEWDEYNAGFCVVWSEYCVDTLEEGHFTVIGNVHENKELLENE